MKTPIAISKMLNKKGLSSNTPHMATVIDDDDPEQLGRVRARIDIFFDHIPDDKIPWSTPEDWSHPQGLKGGESTDRTGTCPGIPIIGNRVALYFRHSGNPMMPSYSTKLPWDKKNQLPEFLENYPNRLGTKLSNGYTHIIDVKTNEVFIHNPGDMNITILGDSNIQVVGNLQLDVTDSKGDVPPYLSNAPATVLGDLNPKPAGQIAFNGFFGGSAGNMHIKTKNHLTFDVGGKFKVKSKSDMSLETGAKMNLKAASKMKAKASKIDLN